MPSKVIADFKGEVYSDELSENEPVSGRVVSNETEIVAVTEDRKLRVPHEDIFDVVEKQPVMDIEFIDTVLTLAYDDDGTRKTLFIGATPQNIRRFRHVLFRSILGDDTYQSIHPARVGGRVVDTDAAPTRLGLSREEVELRQPEGTASIRLANVMDFSRGFHTFDGEDEPWPAVQIGHLEDGESQTTLIGCEDQRVLNLLGRFLQLKYTDLREEIEDLDLSDKEVKALITLYSGGGTASLAQALGVSSATVQSVLDRLEDKELIESDGTEESLTDTGHVVVNERLESVNR